MYYQELDILKSSNMKFEFDDPGIQLSFVRIIDY
jgi:hypothetical protein